MRWHPLNIYPLNILIIILLCIIYISPSYSTSPSPPPFLSPISHSKYKEERSFSHAALHVLQKSKGLSANADLYVEVNCKKQKVFTLSRVKTLFKLINSHWWFHWHAWRRAGLSVSVQIVIYENTMEYHVKENYLKHWSIITLSEYEKSQYFKNIFFFLMWKIIKVQIENVFVLLLGNTRSLFSIWFSS